MSETYHPCIDCGTDMILISPIIIDYNYVMDSDIEYEKTNLYQCPKCKRITTDCW